MENILIGLWFSLLISLIGLLLIILYQFIINISNIIKIGIIINSSNKNTAYGHKDQNKTTTGTNDFKFGYTVYTKNNGNVAVEYNACENINKKSEEYKNIEEYLKDHIEKGYIKEDGTPIKCLFCGSKKLKYIVRDVTAGYTCETEVICEDCNKSTGYWSYGNWEI